MHSKQTGGGRSGEDDACLERNVCSASHFISRQSYPVSAESDYRPSDAAERSALLLGEARYVWLGALYKCE